MIEPSYLAHHAEKFPIKAEAPYSCHRAPSPKRLTAFTPAPATKDTQQNLSFGELLSAESVFNEKEEGQAPTDKAQWPVGFLHYQGELHADTHP
jgi:carbon storage regulator